MVMSAKLLKGGTQVGRQFVPFIIPRQSEPIGEGFWESEAGAPTTKVDSLQSNSDEVKRRAHALLETAQAEADSLIAQAQTRAAQIQREAYEKGTAAARANIAGEISGAVADLREKLSHTLSELEPLYALIATRAERDLVKLALEIARKVVHREVTTDADIVLTLARVALERLHPRVVAKVLLHPEDLAFVIARRHELSNTSTLEFVADASVGRGGCIIQSEHGDIDARIEQQIATIEQGFFQ